MRHDGCGNATTFSPRVSTSATNVANLTTERWRNVLGEFVDSRIGGWVKKVLDCLLNVTGGTASCDGDRVQVIFKSVVR
jgi:hypothetical protein